MWLLLLPSTICIGFRNSLKLGQDSQITLLIGRLIYIVSLSPFILRVAWMFHTHGKIGTRTGGKSVLGHLQDVPIFLHCHEELKIDLKAKPWGKTGRGHSLAIFLRARGSILGLGSFKQPSKPIQGSLEITFYFNSCQFLFVPYTLILFLLIWPEFHLGYK